MICEQVSKNDVHLHSIFSKDLHQCKNKVRDCQVTNNNSPKPESISPLLSQLIFREDYEDISSVNSIVHPFSDPSFKSCENSEGTYCDFRCSRNYFICDNNIKYKMITPLGTVCYQKAINNIELIYSDDIKCNPSYDNDNTITDSTQATKPTIKPTITPGLFICPTSTGYYCAKECERNYGFYECADGKSSYINTQSK